jgi:hypothetical protein
MKPLAAATLLLLCLSGCGGPSDEDVLTEEKIRASESAPQLPDIQLSENPEPPPAPPVPEQPELNELDNEMVENEVEADPLAPVFQDRWGRVPEDCRANGPGNGLIISGNSLVTSGAVGQLAEVIGDHPERFVGLFDYGGQSREEQLVLTGSSNTLIRISGGQRFAYRRCRVASPTG